MCVYGLIEIMRGSGLYMNKESERNLCEKITIKPHFK